MFVLTAGHVVLLPLLFLPLGLFSLGHRRHEGQTRLIAAKTTVWVMWMSSVASLHEWHLYTTDNETNEAA